MHPSSRTILTSKRPTLNLFTPYVGLEEYLALYGEHLSLEQLRMCGGICGHEDDEDGGGVGSSGGLNDDLSCPSRTIITALMKEEGQRVDEHRAVIPYRPDP